MLALAVLARRRIAEREASISGQLPGHTARLPDDWIVALGVDRHTLNVEVRGGSYVVRGADWELSLATEWEAGDLVMAAAIQGEACCAQIQRNGPLLKLSPRRRFAGGAGCRRNTSPPSCPLSR